jgi:hypothetical protein
MASEEPHLPQVQQDTVNLVDAENQPQQQQQQHYVVVVDTTTTADDISATAPNENKWSRNGFGRGKVMYKTKMEKREGLGRNEGRAVLSLFLSSQCVCMDVVVVALLHFDLI